MAVTPRSIARLTILAMSVGGDLRAQAARGGTQGHRGDGHARAAEHTLRQRIGRRSGPASCLLAGGPSAHGSGADQEATRHQTTLLDKRTSGYIRIDRGATYVSPPDVARFNTGQRH